MSEDHPHGEFRFCPHCATRLEMAEIGGSRRPRCPSCHYVRWRNPGVGAAVVVFDGEGRILLVRRAPGATRAGLWSIPAGFVDYGEEIRTAAARELEEETGLTAEIGEVVHAATNFHDPDRVTVGVWFSGTITGGELTAGDDADDAGWFDLDELPPLAFPSDRDLLVHLGEGRG